MGFICKLIIFGILLSAILLITIVSFGKIVLLAEYEEEYKNLKNEIENLPENTPAYFEIISAFEGRLYKLKKYKCRDLEKIEELQQVLHKKIYRP